MFIYIYSYDPLLNNRSEIHKGLSKRSWINSVKHKIFSQLLIFKFSMHCIRAKANGIDLHKMSILQGRLIIVLVLHAVPGPLTPLPQKSPFSGSQNSVN